MKMNNDELVRIVKEQCEAVIRVLERHAESETNKESMKAYRTMSQAKLSAIIDMTIVMYAKEYVDDDNAYWAKVDEIRAYESEKEARLTEVFLSWYEEYLGK